MRECVATRNVIANATGIYSFPVTCRFESVLDDLRQTNLGDAPPQSSRAVILSLYADDVLRALLKLRADPVRHRTDGVI